MSSTLNTIKEQSQAFQPLLLCEITFADGAVLRMSTHDIRSSTQSLQYAGHDYLPVILNQQLAATQALSSEGIDGCPTVTLKLADANRSLWSNYELTKGFKGSDVVLRMVFLDLATNTFSSDSRLIFVGLCDPPSVDEESLTIQCVSLMNMTRTNLPLVRIQRLHPFPFPSTLEERNAAKDDKDSPFYRTGYSADLSGGMGNLQADGSVYTAADFDGTYESYLKVMGTGGGSGATATATISSGRITGITVTNGGSGYTSRAIVTISGNGSGAGAVANMSGDAVDTIDMTGEGYNYSSAIINVSPATGDLLHDHSARYTGTFGGIRWVPPNTYSGKAYIEGKTITFGHG